MGRFEVERYQHTLHLPDLKVSRGYPASALLIPTAHRIRSIDYGTQKLLSLNPVYRGWPLVSFIPLAECPCPVPMYPLRTSQNAASSVKPPKIPSSVGIWDLMFLAYLNYYLPTHLFPLADRNQSCLPSAWFRAWLLLCTQYT